MRRLSIALVLTVAVLGASAAQAATITDTHNPADFLMDHQGSDCRVVFTAPCEKYQWTHNILDDGYDPLTFNLTSALLTILLSDDGTGDTPADKVEIFLDGTLVSPGGGHDAATSFVYTFGSVSVFASLKSDGLLTVLLDAQAGDFTFQRSDLQATFVPNTTGPGTPTPEPAALLLFGTALLVVGRRFARRGTVS